MRGGLSNRCSRLSLPRPLRFEEFESLYGARSRSQNQAVQCYFEQFLNDYTYRVTDCESGNLNREEAESILSDWNHGGWNPALTADRTFPPQRQTSRGQPFQPSVAPAGHPPSGPRRQAPQPPSSGSASRSDRRPLSATSAPVVSPPVESGNGHPLVLAPSSRRLLGLPMPQLPASSPLMDLGATSFHTALRQRPSPSHWQQRTYAQDDENEQHPNAPHRQEQPWQEQQNPYGRRTPEQQWQRIRQIPSRPSDRQHPVPGQSSGAERGTEARMDGPAAGRGRFTVSIFLDGASCTQAPVHSPTSPVPAPVLAPRHEDPRTPSPRPQNDQFTPAGVSESGATALGTFRRTPGWMRRELAILEDDKAMILRENEEAVQAWSRADNDASRARLAVNEEELREVTTAIDALYAQLEAGFVQAQKEKEEEALRMQQQQSGEH